MNKDIYDLTDSNSYQNTINNLKKCKDSKLIKAKKMPDKCGYDAVFINSSNKELQVEIKDRTINYQTKQPQYTYTYPTAMFEVNKYETLITETESPVYCATYTDGVILYDLKRLNAQYGEDISKSIKEAENALKEGNITYSNEWCAIKPVKRKTVQQSQKIHQVKLDLPIPTKEENYKNNYCKIYFNDDK